MLCVVPIPALQYGLLIPLAQILKEIVFQDPGNLHQCLRIDPRAGVDEIDIVAVAAQLLRKPRGPDALPCHYLFDELAYMWIHFLHVPVWFLSFGITHKKSVEPIPCLNVRVSTPYISNKLFHAVSLRHS